MAQEEPTLPKGLSQDAPAKQKEPELPQGLLPDKPSEPAEPALPGGLEEEPKFPGEVKTGENVPAKESSWNSLRKKLGLTGFGEVRFGVRTQNDKYERDISISESRVQLELEKAYKGFVFNVTSDLVYDPVFDHHKVYLEEGRGFLDIREASAAFSPLDFMDVKMGRQILTWGTGDLLFINDMFPKDWQSFFIGRDVEYLKAPSDAVKVSLFHEMANLDIVYSPRFDSDRYITGERISYWNDGLGIRAGRDAVVETDKPDDCFKNDEWAARLSKNIAGYEGAIYGYWGYWKSPGGMDPLTMEALFPRLAVYGASVRGQVGKGIGNLEVGYYDSRQDRSGKDPFINNSQIRLLAGYERDLPEVVSDFTIGVQYYLERMQNHDDYEDYLPPTIKKKDENRQVATLRVTKLLMNQNLTCSLFTYFSPTDKDVYMRPNVKYKVTDNLAVEGGANIFFGDYPHTFFGQFHKNTNVYTALRYSF